MNETTNVFAWPTSSGYLTVKPLSTKSPCAVWLVRRESDQLYFVLKLSLTKEKVDSARQKESVITRKYVVDFHGSLTTPSGEGLLMEYCPGGSLASLVRKRSPFTPGECVTALAPIAQTIAAMHAEGQRHGDVSPNNILLTAQGMPKIIDFQDSTFSYEEPGVAGTPGFIPPEVLRGDTEQYFGVQDVYALGACLWYLLDGRSPDAPDQRPPIQVHFPQLPAILQELLVDSLSADPARRPSAEEFSRTLFAGSVAEPIHWEGHIDPEANYLMDTIHPTLPVRRPRKTRGARVPREQAGETHRAKNGSWQGNALRRTPGGRKIFTAGALGALVIGASFIAVNQFSGTPGTEPVAAAPPQATSCRIQDVANVPACAFETDTVVAAFLSLASLRDDAMTTSDARSLTKIYLNDSAQLAHDQQTLGKLEDLNLSLKGLHTTLEEITVVARSASDTVVLSASSIQSAYTYVDDQDGVVHRVAAGKREWIQIEIKLVEGQWKLGNVLSRQA